MRLYHGWVEAAPAQYKAACARRFGLAQSAITVADSTRGISHEGRAAQPQSQRSRRQFCLTFGVDELIEVDKHFDAQIARQIVAACRGAKLPDARAGAGDLEHIGDADRGFNGGIDLDRARIDSPLTFENRNNRIQQTHFFRTLGLGILYPAHAGPDNCFQVGQNEVVVDSHEYLCPTPRNVGDRVFDEASRVGL
jgi:hypothetical protein